jgi:Zn-dependent metalloprotease
MSRKEKAGRKGKTLFLVSIFTALLFVFSAADMGAQNNSILNSLKFKPVLNYQSITPAGTSSQYPPDPVAVNIETALKEKLEKLKQKKEPAVTAQDAATDRQHSNAAQLRNRLSKELDIWIRNNAGTPRQIKIKKEAKRSGVVLERAARGSAIQLEQDKKTARNFLRSKRGLLRISDPDNELRLSKYIKDSLKCRHLRYSQTFKNLPVWPAELNVHLDQDGNVDLMNGAFIPTPKRMVTKPLWSAAEAIEVSRKVVPDAEDAKPNEPTLIIYAPSTGAYRLAWKVELSVSIKSNWLVIVDALNGSVLNVYNQVMSTQVSGSGTDLFGQTRQLDLWQENNAYYLIDTSKTMYDESSDPPAIDSTRGAIIIMDMEHNELPQQGGSFNVSFAVSQNKDSGWLPDSVSLAHCISETYDYYLDRHNRSSFDGKGSSAIGLVRVGQNYANAFWNTEYNAMFFGDAKPYAGALDVVAHEFTHGLTASTCDLIYQDQPGALNEAFSDIFGEMVEDYSTGSTDWINGTLLNDDGRNMKNPSSVEVLDGYYYPSKMSEYYSRNHPLLQQLVNQDYGGVHINTTIVSHCYYLVAEGLDNAIGLQDAAKIFHRAQTIHLLKNSQFIDARLACINAAEELFGANSNQVTKIKEAFDRVEIFDNVSTPEPPPIQAVSGDDSALFIYYDPYYASYFLARYEKALNDQVFGTTISCYDAARTRPSVTGDGSLAFFVDSINDACFVATNPTDCEECLGYSGEINSVAMSPDGNVYGFVFLDQFGDPTNTITVIDISPNGKTRTFPLIAPATEGASLNTILYADSMDFTSDNRYLVYDAYNVFEFSDGTKLGVWSIYAIDLITEQTIPLIEPYADLDIGFPALSQTTNHIMTFDVVDYTTGNTNIVTYDFFNDNADIAGIVSGSWSCPGYTGDDSAIVYSMPDASSSTGFSLVRQSLQNSITPTGDPSLYMSDAEYGVIYRRGNFTSPVPDISISPQAVSMGQVSVGTNASKQIAISNTGTGDLVVESVTLSGTNANMFKIIGGCTGQTIPSAGSCKFNVDFLPASAGQKSAAIEISSNDPDEPKHTINISGTGVAAPSQAPTANAGTDQSVTEGNTVTLDGTASSDAGGTIAAYTWTQTDSTGNAVTLSSTSASKPTFTAPDVASAVILIFSLTVTDNDGLTSTADTVRITVNPQSPDNNDDDDGGGGGGGGGCFISSLVK